MKNRSDDNECATFIYAHLWLETWYGNEVEINLADLIKLLHTTRSFCKISSEDSTGGRWCQKNLLSCDFCNALMKQNILIFTSLLCEKNYCFIYLVAKNI